MRAAKIFKLIKIYKNWPAFLWHKFFVESDWILETRGGSKINIRKNEEADAYVANESWLYGLHEKLLPYLKSAGIGIDIGAHIGTFTLWAAERSPATIYAFEPAENNLEALRENIKLNNLEKRVKILPFVVSSENGEKDFYIAKNSGMNSTLKNWTELRADAGGLEKVVKVKSVSLADFLKDLDVCDFMKIDIEGAEYELLMNLPDESYKKIRSLSIEISNHEKELIDHIERKGFKLLYNKGNYVFGK